MAKRESVFLNTYRCIYCKHSGEWVTIYVKAFSFTETFKYIKDLIDMWVIKEISEKLENGELVGKEIISAKPSDR